MLLSSISVYIIIFLVGSSLSDDSSCSTPIECYTKALALLQRDREMMREVADKFYKSEKEMRAEISMLKEENKKLKDRMSDETTKLKENMNEEVKKVKEKMSEIISIPSSTNLHATSKTWTMPSAQKLIQIKSAATLKIVLHGHGSANGRLEAGIFINGVLTGITQRDPSNDTNIVGESISTGNGTMSHPIISFAVITVEAGDYIIDSRIRNNNPGGEVYLWLGSMIVEIIYSK